jgi:hypothetical protein
MNSVEKNITILQDKIYSVNFDISKSFLPNEEIIKNMIKSQYPQYSDEMLNMMVGIPSVISGITASTISNTISGLSASVTNTISGLTSSISKSTKELGDFAKKNNIWPLPKSSSYHKEVDKRKDEIRKAVMLMIKEQKELMQDLVKVSIQTGTSISGASILISPPSFNIPGAISLVLLVLAAISALVAKIMSTIENLAPLKYLSLVIPKNKFNSIVAPINAALKILISLFDSTKLLQKLIEKLMKVLKKRIKRTNPIATQEKSCAALVIDLDNLKKAKVGTVGKIAGIKKRRRPTKAQLAAQTKLIEDKIVEIEECQEKVKILKSVEDISLDELSLNELLDNIDPLNEMREISEVNSQFLSYVYDVHFPDGSVINNLDDTELENIKLKYDLIFDNKSSD